MHQRLFLLVLAPSPDLANQGSIMEEEFSVCLPFLSWCSAVQGPELTAAPRWFEFPPLCTMAAFVLRLRCFFSKFSMFVWQGFSAASSSDAVPVLFLCLHYPITVGQRCAMSLSLWCEVWWQRDQVSPGRAVQLWPVMAVRSLQKRRMQGEAQELLSREGRSQMCRICCCIPWGLDLHLVLCSKILGT